MHRGEETHHQRRPGPQLSTSHPHLRAVYSDPRSGIISWCFKNVFPQNHPAWIQFLPCLPVRTESSPSFSALGGRVLQDGVWASPTLLEFHGVFPCITFNSTSLSTSCRNWKRQGQSRPLAGHTVGATEEINNKGVGGVKNENKKTTVFYLQI